MKSYQILNLKILLGIIIFYGCNAKNEGIVIKSYSPDACEIMEVHDKALSPGSSVVGYKFICDKSDTIKELSLLKNNPWRHIEFALLPHKNPYIGFGPNFESPSKQGSIYYDLKLSSWKEVNSKFKIKTNQHPDSLFFTYAHIACRPKAYLPKYVLTNYWLSVTGVKDTLQPKNRNTIFLENQIKLYSANGDTILNLISNEYVSTGAQIDSTYTTLIFRTSRRDSILDYSGFQIYNIANDSMLFKFEKDSNYLVFTPVLFGNYAVIEVNKEYFSKNPTMYESHPFQIIVYDIAKKHLYQRLYPKNYKYRFSTVSGHYLVYESGDDDYVPIEYDSVRIENLSDMAEIK